jgi:hypothetical protein
MRLKTNPAGMIARQLKRERASWHCPECCFPGAARHPIAYSKRCLAGRHKGLLLNVSLWT